MPREKNLRVTISAATTPPLPHQIPPDTLIDPGIGQNQATLPREFLDKIQMAPLPPQLPILPKMRDLHEVFPAMTNMRKDAPLLMSALWLDDPPLFDGEYLPGHRVGSGNPGHYRAGAGHIWQAASQWRGLGEFALEEDQVVRVAYGLPMDVRVRVSTTRSYSITSWLAALVDVTRGDDYVVVRLPNELELGMVPGTDILEANPVEIRQTLIREIGYGVLDDDEIEQMKDPKVGRTILTKRFWHTIMPDLVDFDEWIVTEMTLFQTQQEMQGIR